METTPVASGSPGFDAEQRVSWVSQRYPATIPVFRRYSYDCCDGKRTLAELASLKQLPLDQLLNELQAAVAARTRQP